MSVEQYFSKMATGKMNSKGQKLSDGHYTVESKFMKLKVGGHFGDSFIFEFIVAKSNNPEHPEGSQRTYTVNMGKVQAFGDIKALIFALLMEIDPATVADPNPSNQKQHDEAVDFFKMIVEPAYAKSKSVEEDFYVGFLVDVDVQVTKTQAGHDWVRHKWTPATQEDAVAA